MLSDNLILGSHIVVAEQNADQLIENGNILQDGRIIVSQSDTTTLLPDRIILPGETGIADNRQILLANSEPTQNFAERSVYKGDEFDKNHLVHLGYNTGLDATIARTNIEGGLCDNGLDGIATVYTNLQNVSKKRKLSQDSPLVKSEPGKSEILCKYIIFNFVVLRTLFNKSIKSSWSPFYVN